MLRTVYPPRIIKHLRSAGLVGTMTGLGSVYLAAVGILLTFNGRWIVVHVLSLGHVTLVAAGFISGTVVAQCIGKQSKALICVCSVIAGSVAGFIFSALVVLMESSEIRSVFISLSPDLFDMLTLGLSSWMIVPVIIVGGAFFALLGGLFYDSPAIIRRPVLVGSMVTLCVGVFQELIQLIMGYEGILGAMREIFFTWEGLKWESAIAVFMLATGVSLLWKEGGLAVALRPRPAHLRLVKRTFALLVILMVPAFIGSYMGQVFTMVCLYVLLGIGLHIKVGLTGLLDLGSVAFFAVGAYATALLTAHSPYALSAYTNLPPMSFWAAMPIAVLLSVGIGVIFGAPVLGVRGDYLAVATLGLGEITRVIVQSDMAAPMLAGAEGILQVPKPSLAGIELNGPVELFYITFLASAVAAYCAWRLENSRFGRAWMALREDEDVAQALGISLIKSKLLAYGFGAAFAGLAGSIFAVMVTSVYPSSFNLFVSFNTLALLIVGGVGSLSGVVVGGVALIGLPELLREFGDYRVLLYGAAIVVMMRVKPEGLYPSATRRRAGGVQGRRLQDGK